jgi:hypothetical protein
MSAPKPVSRSVQQPAPVPADQATPVSGFEMQAVSTMTSAQKTIGALGLLLLAALLFGFGYWRRGGR